MHIPANFKEIGNAVNAALTVSFGGELPDFKAGSICVAPVQQEAGVCFSARSTGSAFSFTEKSKSILETLYLTVRNKYFYFSRKVRHITTFVAERAKNVVRTTAPRFLRL